ncbi:hypothetical protein Ae201684P_007800 [Aphanomyces euteiches]|uniref:RxLR effector protein n=1 Tax=Aphanomyces euteiches TaxID=100861 RepID=A0A6G0W438_9STRA|nr:hypothetical protein Ae201684_018954 [Aphanomyces euteiches]KAH9089632.1 hypothetical protein Ae201684P_007800 [Aphanomyces euteiches]
MRLLLAVLCALIALTAAGVRNRNMDILPTIKEDKEMKVTGRKQKPPKQNPFAPKDVFDVKTSNNLWKPKKSFGDRVRDTAAKLTSCVGACFKGRKGSLERVSGGQVGRRSHL